MSTSALFSRPALWAICLFLAGFSLRFSFAPYALWPLALLAPGLLGLALKRCAGQGFMLSFCFGLGLFGGGISWVYVSIHDFGFTAALPALLLTAIFISFLAFISALPFTLFCKLGLQQQCKPLAFAAVWTLGEWLRVWLFTGFPWLFVGYAHTSTVLNGWAPLVGALGLSFISVYSGYSILNFLLLCLSEKRWQRVELFSVPLFLTFFALGYGLQKIEWTSLGEQNVSIAIVQPNVPLELKWDPEQFQSIADKLDQDASSALDVNLQVWPEAAVPSVYHSALPFIEDFSARARAAQTNIISGVLYDTADEHFYNSVAGFGLAEGLYHKQRLVPFGEYMPFEKWLRGLINFFNLPNSIIEVGPWNDSGIRAQSPQGKPYIVAPYICYEVVYPDLVAKTAGKADVLITISNDAWFGNSIGPLQHFQMAQMRAIEQRKFMIRSTNTGLSGVIDPYGNVTAQAPQFRRTQLRAAVDLRPGSTPFSYLGSWPLVIFCFASLTALWRYKQILEKFKHA